MGLLGFIVLASAAAGTAFGQENVREWNNQGDMKFYGGISGFEAGKYSFLLMAEKWSPTFCNEAGCGNSECQAISSGANYAADHLVLHGLWPQLDRIYPDHSDGCNERAGCAYPQFCTKDLSRFDPNNLPDNAQDYAPAWVAGLASHEWEKHGSCAFTNHLPASSAEAQKAFFNTTIAAFLASDKLDLSDVIGKSVSAQTLYNRLQFASGLGCSKKCELDAVYTCWSRSNENTPDQQIDCPNEGILDSGYSNGCKTCSDITVPAFPCGASGDSVL
jgi:ribonuclease T2